MSMSSISLEKHAMAAAPQAEYVSNQMSPLCDFWLASEIGRGQTIEFGVEINNFQEWNWRCSTRAEDDLSHVDAIAQAKANLEMLQTTGPVFC